MNAQRLKEVGIDYDKGILFFGKDVALYEKYLREFAKEDMLEDAIYCFSYGNIQGTFTSVHKLKALIEYIKIPKVDEMVHELTETLRAGKSEGVEVGLIFLEDVLRDVKTGILKEIEMDQKSEK